MQNILWICLLCSMIGFGPGSVLADTSTPKNNSSLSSKKIEYLPNSIQRLVKNFRSLDLKYKDSGATLTKYGYNIYEDINTLTNTGIRIRGGLSKVSKTATTGIELVINW